MHLQNRVQDQGQYVLHAYVHLIWQIQITDVFTEKWSAIHGIQCFLNSGKWYNLKKTSQQNMLVFTLQDKLGIEYIDKWYNNNTKNNHVSAHKVHLQGL